MRCDAAPRGACARRRVSLRASASAAAPSTDAFEAWLQQRGLPAQPLALRAGARGRGLFATSPLLRGAALLRVPEALLLTRRRCIADAPPELRAALEALPEWSCLAAFLATQRHLGDASAWAPYLAQLPAQPGGLLSWPPGAAEALLRGTSLAPEAAARAASVDAAAAALPPQLLAAGASPEAMRWAFAQLFSRLIRLPGLDDTLALCPWADFVNHTCAADAAHLDWDAAERAVVLRPGRAHAAGDEVLGSYGARSSGELLLSYGFAPCAQPGSEAELNAPNETVTLRLRLRGADADAAAPLRAAAWAQASGESDDGAATFALRAGGGFAPGLLPWARLAAAQCADAVQAAALAAAAAEGRGQGALAQARGSPPPRADDAAAWEFVLTAVRDALRGLDAADAAAEAGPQQQPAAAGKGSRAQAKAKPPASKSKPQAAPPRLEPELVAAAAAVRRVERRVLQRAEFLIRAELRTLARG